MSSFDPYAYAPHIPQTTYGPRLCDVLEYGYDLGLSDYPIFDEGYRDELNQKIVDHFYTREIADETPALFVFHLNREMRERMPQINKVYELLRDRGDISVTSTSDQREESERTTQSESTDETKSGSRTDNYTTNAPQVSMVGKDAVDYYDTGVRAESSSTGDGTNRSKGSAGSTGTAHAESSSGSVSDLIGSWYDGYNNADLLVFDALERCFCQLWRPVADAF